MRIGTGPVPSFGVRVLVLALLLFLTAGWATAQIDVMFSEDFEDENAGDAPDKFVPSGSANPDWDNQLYNPGGATVDFNEIEAASVGGNTTKKYHLKPVDGIGEKPLLLGLNFNPSSDRFVVMEYDILTADNPLNGPAGVIVYADGYGDLDGTQPNLRIALMVHFNDFEDVGDDYGGNAGIYRSLNFGNDASAFHLPGAQTEYILRDDGDSNAFAWATNKWYRVQVIADQVDRTFDIKVTDKLSGSEQTATNLPFNNSVAGYVRKIWFYSGDKKGDVYVDNILVYESTQAPPAAGPTIVFQEYSKGPANANTGLDVDFFDDTDLQSIQYKIGTSGTWTDLTSNGTNAFNLAGGGDDVLTALVYITDTDFTTIMSEGENRIYFRAEDDMSQITESAAYLSFFKDTQPPNTATVEIPNSATIPALSSIAGSLRDAVSGVGTNTATFTLQRQDTQYWNGAGWQGAAAPLPTTHTGTSDDSTSTWVNSGGLPALTGEDMIVRVSVDDNLGNGLYSGSPVTFMVIPEFPEITININEVGPARDNASAPMDVDFSDNTDLQFIEYKIGVAGPWTGLTSDGNAAIDLTGGPDPIVAAAVYIRNADFDALPEGESDIYFRAEDDLSNASETSIPLIFQKDTLAPGVVTVAIPATDPFSSLPTVAGQIGDAAGGCGFEANSATFSIQSSDGNYWTGSGWGGAPTQLPTTHPATADDTVVNWVKNVSLPTLPTPPPNLTGLTNGLTYTFGTRITDRAGNTTNNSVSYLFSDVPEVASVTTPGNNSYTNSSPAPQGRAGDHESGSGLNSNSTTFTYRRSDGRYWNGAGWQLAVANLPTTHPAATSSNQVTWTPAGPPPGAGDLSDGAYSIQATAVNINAGSLTGASVTVNYDTTVPQINSGTMAPDNSYATLAFSEKVWGNSSRNSAIDPSDFTVNFQQNTGAVTSATIAGFYEDSGLTTALSATTGYSVVYAELNNVGGPATGVETITITANAVSIYDIASNAMSAAETTGAINYINNDVTPPSLSTLSTADTDGDGSIDRLVATFDEAVDESTIAAGNFSTDIGTVTTVVDDGTAADAVIWVNLTDGALATDEVPQLTIAAGGIEDLPGNPNALIANFASTDAAGPAILSAVASDETNIITGIDNDDTVTLTFSEATNQPALNAGNIDTVLSLSASHSWVDGASGITSAAWSAADTLVITLSDTTGDPTVAVGDTITTDGSTITDSTNGSATAASPAISGTFGTVTPLTLTSLITADTDSDGYINRLILTFDRAVNEATIIGSKYYVSQGTISTVADDGTPADAGIWINLVDGVLDSGSRPLLTIQAGGIEDTLGVGNSLISNFQAADGAPPVLMHTLAVVGEKTVYVKFSEPVSGNAAVVSLGDMSYSGGGNSIVAVIPLNRSGLYSDSVFLSLSNALTAADIVPPANTVSVSPAPPPPLSAILDREGLAASTTPHRVSDLLLGAVEPAWANNGDTVRVARKFNGTENLEFRDITLQAYDSSGGPLQIFYDSNVDLAVKTNGLWLPAAVPGLVSTANSGATTQGPFASAPPLNDFLLAQGDLSQGNVEFGFEVIDGLGDPLYCLRIVNPKDPRTVAMWSLSVQDKKVQRGGTTILNNVLKPRLGGETTLVYSLSEAGIVTILVSDMKGDIVAVLARELQSAGEHSVTWDGRNRGTRIVAPGLYYIKIVGPGITEVRKILVAR